MIPVAIHIEVIDHSAQRYPTVGDWWVDDTGALQIRVSRTKTPIYVWLVGIHEMIEAVLSLAGGVTVEAVDQFDLEWEKTHDPDSDEEPGDDPACPVHREHVIATICERAVAFVAGVNWNEYEAEITALWQSTR